MEKNKLIIPDNRIVGLNNKPIKVKEDLKYEEYEKILKETKESPVPEVDLLHSQVLVRATPPEIIRSSGSGLIINQVKLDDYLTQDKLDKMSQNVSDEQEILAVGQFILDNGSESKKEKLKPGRYVKIDFRRFKTLRDNHQAGIVETFYDIPVFTINNNKYMVIDERDILWAFDKK